MDCAGVPEVPSRDERGCCLMSERKKLADILNGGTDSIKAQWAKTEAAADFAPLPKGSYSARIVDGELGENRNGTPRYKLTFRVLDGEHAGRQFWHDVFLTPQSLPMAKRDLAKLGITKLEQLETPLPAGIRCDCKLSLQKGDDGTEYNRLRSFDVVGIDENPSHDADFGPQPEPVADDGESLIDDTTTPTQMDPF